MSSFGYLKNLPVDVIKIDGSFIRELEHDAMSRSIVNAITEIGHQRGLEVVAECVASARVVELLRELGVDYGQGYALHRPERVLRSEEHTSELQSLMRISYAVCCLIKKSEGTFWVRQEKI